MISEEQKFEALQKMASVPVTEVDREENQEDSYAKSARQK